MNLFSAALGRERFFVAEENLPALWNLFLFESVSFSDFSFEEDGASFWVLASDAKKLRKLAGRTNLTLVCKERRGLIALIHRYRRRWGLLFGGLLGLFLLILSSQVVWDVRVVGNERLSTGEIEDLLESAGLYPGARLKALHAGELENRVLLATDKLAWLSVNLSGTVAHVQVMESVPPPAPEDRSPANLVAARDGQIELLQLYRGKSVVKIGQAVTKGQLLVSGISDNRNGGFFYTRAAGEVLARTDREIRVEIPFAQKAERTTEGRVQEVTLRFFHLCAKIYKRTGKEDGECAIIEVQKGLTGAGLSRLPVFLTLTLARERESYEIERSPEEALALAYETLDEELGRLSEDVQLLRKEIKTEWGDESVALVCSLHCMENIAHQVAFEVLP